ncbi:hypothetical protein GS682_09495 [Nostoc sp. B(2019)]|nr:hypothetical protein [Nostoc sp. B(2019)]
MLALPEAVTLHLYTKRAAFPVLSKSAIALINYIHKSWFALIKRSQLLKELI